jgi:hypothetical protein
LPRLTGLTEGVGIAECSSLLLGDAVGERERGKPNSRG